MAWQDDMTEVLRVMVNDLASERFTDDTLERSLVVAAFQVLRDASFSQSFVVSIAQSTILPDPTLEATRDDSFVNLVTLKAACIIDQGAAASGAATTVTSVTDGGTRIAFGDGFRDRIALLKEGWCAEYKKALFDYKRGAAGAAGHAVVTPFRLLVNGGRHVLE